MEADEKILVLRYKKARSIEEALEELDVLIEPHFFNEFTETNSSAFLKTVITNHNSNNLNLFKRTWSSINGSPNMMKAIREIQENLLCVGKRREMITKKKPETKCWCSKTGLQLNSKHIVSCCKRTF